MKTKTFVWMEIKFILRKNGDHIPGSLGGRSIVVVRQASNEIKFLKFDNFSCEVHL